MSDFYRESSSRLCVRVFITSLLVVTSVQAEVLIYVEPEAGAARIRYHCNAGEVVRAFALDVSVDRGRIIGVSDFFRGESTSEDRGYGIFPSAFRDHIPVGQAAGIDWLTPGYIPVATASDRPEDTLPGLGTSGVTLEFGALWDPLEPGAIPDSQGALCTLQITRGANLTLAANQSRGGVVAVHPDMTLAPVFVGGFVQPPQITGFSISNDVLRVTFAGGELETSPDPNGPWSGTGNVGGEYFSQVADGINRFYRVRSH